MSIAQSGLPVRARRCLDRPPQCRYSDPASRLAPTDSIIEHEPAKQIVIPIRVRYVECDPMNVAHHSAYLPWLELARTELLRQMGMAYRDMEARGQFMVVARLTMRYRKPARYDDELQVQCRQQSSRGAKLVHDYEIRRDDELLCTGETTLVCVDGQGRLQEIPAELMG